MEVFCELEVEVCDKLEVGVGVCTELRLELDVDSDLKVVVIDVPFVMPEVVVFGATETSGISGN